jgi:endonuclease/exonuclease/phosphatase family metal-dependent hydrolase
MHAFIAGTAAFLLALLLTACDVGSTVSAVQSRTFPVTVTTWNIRNAGDEEPPYKRWANRRHRMLRYMRTDIVALQEVEWGQLQFLADELEDYAYVAKGRDGSVLGIEIGEMCPIFYRTDSFQALEGSTFWYSETPDRVSQGDRSWGSPNHRRICTWVKLRRRAAPGEVFYVFNTHWQHNSPSTAEGQQFRLRAAFLLWSRVRTIASDSPFLVVGDLNASSKPSEGMTDASIPVDWLVGRVTLRILGTTHSTLSYRFNDVYIGDHPESNDGTARANEWPDSSAGLSRIDYIFTSAREGPDLTESSIIEPGERLSDHLPVTALILLVQPSS